MGQRWSKRRYQGWIYLTVKIEEAASNGQSMHYPAASEKAEYLQTATTKHIQTV